MKWNLAKDNVRPDKVTYQYRYSLCLVKIGKSNTRILWYDNDKDYWCNEMVSDEGRLFLVPVIPFEKIIGWYYLQDVVTLLDE